jgi:hypothetical protein
VKEILLTLQLFFKLLDLATKLAQTVGEERFKQWEQDVDEAIKKTKEAKSPEDFRNAALDLVRATGRIPK